MKVNILLFAAARDAVGSEHVGVEVGRNATVGELREAILRQCEPLRQLLPHAMIAVNSEYATPDAPLRAEDEVALIPPVSGG